MGKLISVVVAFFVCVFAFCADNPKNPVGLPNEPTTVFPHTPYVENDDWRNDSNSGKGKVNFSVPRPNANRGLKKIAVTPEDRLSFAKSRAGKVTDLVIKASDSSSNYEFSFLFKGDTCAGYFFIPKSKYKIQACLEYAQRIPWDSAYALYNRPFIAETSIDLTAGNAVLDLTFQENIGLSFFIFLDDPIGKFTENTKYWCENGSGKNSCFFKDGALQAWIYSGNIDSYIGQLSYADDSGKTYQISFTYNYKQLIDSGFIRIDSPHFVLGQIDFEFKFPPHADSAAYKNDYVCVYFSQNGYPWHRDSSFLFKITDLDSNRVISLDSTLNFSSGRGNLLFNTTFLYWEAIPRLTAGKYSVEISGIANQYGKKMEGTFKDTITVN